MRKTGVLVVLALSTVLPMAAPAGAATLPGAAVLTGSGTVTPLPLLPPGVVATSFLSASLTGVVDGFPFSASCNLTFNTVPIRVGGLVLAESDTFGSGTWSGSCGGTALINNCNGTYARAAAALVMIGGCTINGILGSWSAGLLWEPSNVNPTTTYSAAGAVALIQGSI